MFADNAGPPPWMLRCKDALLTTSEWSAMSGAVHTEVQRLLAASHVLYFADLNSDEQAVLMDEVERNLAGSAPHAAVERQLTGLLQSGIARQVDAGLAAVGGSRHTKLDLILKASAEGATTLLRALPAEQKGSFRLMLNCEFPDPLRWHAWRHHLREPRGRAEYARRAARSRIDTMSSLDTAITARLELVLDRSVLGGRVSSEHGAVVLLKTALSYLHALATSGMSSGMGGAGVDAGRDAAGGVAGDGAGGGGGGAAAAASGGGSNGGDSDLTDLDPQLALQGVDAEAGAIELGGAAAAAAAAAIDSPYRSFLPLLAVFEPQTSDPADYVEAALALQARWPRCMAGGVGSDGRSGLGP